MTINETTMELNTGTEGLDDKFLRYDETVDFGELVEGENMLTGDDGTKFVDIDMDGDVDYIVESGSGDIFKHTDYDPNDVFCDASALAGLIIGLVVGSLLIAAIVGTVYLCKRSSRRKREAEEQRSRGNNRLPGPLVVDRRRLPSTPFLVLADKLNLSSPRIISRKIHILSVKPVQPDLFVRVLRVKHIGYYAVPALALSCLFQILWIRLGIHIYKRCKTRRRIQLLDSSNATAELTEIVIEP